MKVAVVTGASGAIGGETARLLAASGYNVIVAYNRSKEKAEETVNRILEAGGEAVAFEADLRRSENADALVSFAIKTYGRLDLLAHCAGKAQFSLASETTDCEWRDILDADLSSAFFCCRAALREMTKRKSGSVVLTSSMWASRGSSCEAAYSAAKAGVEGLTKALAKEYSPSGITVNCVAPGFIDTEMNARLSAREREEFLSEVPVGRAGTAREVAEAILFLAQNKYVNGAVLPIDGGY